ncbi:MAG: phospholipid/glycerol acyltransferase [Puniceicoccaceae bacterium 5H]|nr:MAG: phospholipid/glycerol acyltransferase [Puniceicoccaceae bacterium 5H]
MKSTRPSLAHRLLQPWWIVCYYVFLLLFGLGSMGFNLLCGGLKLLPRQPSPERVRGWIHGIMRLYVGLMQGTGVAQVSYQGFEHLPRDRGMIIAANHPSILDAPLFLARYPHLVCLYKAALHNSLLRPAAAELAGYLSNEGGVDAIRRAASQLEEGSWLLVFPEGTRTENGALNRLQPGFAFIAQRSRAPVQTVLVRNHSNVLSKRRRYFQVPELPARVELEVGERFYPDDGETIREFTQRIEAYLRAELEKDLASYGAEAPNPAGEILEHPSGPHPQLQHGLAPAPDGEGCAHPLESRVGGDRW